MNITVMMYIYSNVHNRLLWNKKKSLKVNKQIFYIWYTGILLNIVYKGDEIA